MTHGVQGAAMPTESGVAVKNRIIRNREDLSFVKRDSSGRLRNWAPPELSGDWDEDYTTGNRWFDEVVQLIRRRPREAETILNSIIVDMLVGGGSIAARSGFMDCLTRWTITGILCNPPSRQPHAKETHHG